MNNYDKLKKEFSLFCKISGGNFIEDNSLQCTKEKYYIKIYYNDLGLSISAGSKFTGDYDLLNLNNTKIVDVERISGNNDLGELEFYILKIYLDKGLLYIKRSVKEDKIIIHLQMNDLEYESSVLF
ncbi:hypothetical protein MJ1_0545 [Nanobdella aerobiophila]|uniref:Uncharacterized protein n=1 Tax=Nanobdella aerobiophila TaxID=2586965 RepID=A0A915SKK2_9ARCH|nr:hypothetical protein [Nanobdella aerobiophila]BBL45698.1 hypothetical protein MJ1_0545 [Nanobdella aerobiophila]